MMVGNFHVKNNSYFDDCLVRFCKENIVANLQKYFETFHEAIKLGKFEAVSYTHLTLPTILRV